MKELNFNSNRLSWSYFVATLGGVSQSFFLECMSYYEMIYVLYTDWVSTTPCWDKFNHLGIYHIAPIMWVHYPGFWIIVDPHLPCSVSICDWLALCVHLFGLICINSYQFVMICIDSVPVVIKQYQGDPYYFVFVFVICINSGSTCIDLYQSDLYHQSRNQQPSICSAGLWSRSPFLESSGNLFVLLYVDELYFIIILFTEFRISSLC